MIRCVRDLREARMRGSGLRRSGIRRRHARTRRHATYRTEHQRTKFRGRRPYHTTCRLCGEPAEEKAHRGAVRPGQDDRRTCAAHASGRREARLQVKFTLTMAGYNLIRLPKLIAAQA